MTACLQQRLPEPARSDHLTKDDGYGLALTTASDAIVA